MCAVALTRQPAQLRCALTLQQIGDRQAAAAHYMPPAATAVLSAGDSHDRPRQHQLPPTIVQVSSAGGPATPAVQRCSDFGNTAAPATIAQQRRSSSSTSGATNSNPLAGWRLQVRSGAQQRIDLPAAP
jgi:hypothetical protein